MTSVRFPRNTYYTFSSSVNNNSLELHTKKDALKHCRLYFPQACSFAVAKVKIVAALRGNNSAAFSIEVDGVSIYGYCSNTGAPVNERSIDWMVAHFERYVSKIVKQEKFFE